jgi:hypothetical protein
MRTGRSGSHRLDGTDVLIGTLVLGRTASEFQHARPGLLQSNRFFSGRKHGATGVRVASQLREQNCFTMAQEPLVAETLVRREFVR